MKDPEGVSSSIAMLSTEKGIKHIKNKRMIFLIVGPHVYNI
jgi:hypothetical protein